MIREKAKVILSQSTNSVAKLKYAYENFIYSMNTMKFFLYD